MRNTSPLMIAAALLVAAPAYAQENSVANDAATAVDNAAATTEDAASDAMNDMATAPPVETMPVEMNDPAAAPMPAEDNDGGEFPWGLLGLLGLVGLIPRNRS